MVESKLTDEQKHQVRFYWGLKSLKWIEGHYHVSRKTIAALMKPTDEQALDYVRWYHGQAGQAFVGACNARASKSRGNGKPGKR